MKFPKSAVLASASLAFIAAGTLSIDTNHHLVFSQAKAVSPVTPEEYYGCSMALKRFRKELQQQNYAAFARGRAFSITGMRGCGYAWNKKSQAQADQTALRNCRKKARNPDKCYVSDRTK
jgi:hypothetical protein